MNVTNYAASELNKFRLRAARLVVSWYALHKSWLRPLLIAGLLLLLALLLSACSSYPGQDPPCTGANRNAAGCQNPSAGVKDDPIGGEWYIDWSFKILRSLLSSFSISAVQLGVGIFWGIYTNLASTDFLACSGGGGSGGSNPTCSAVGAFETIRNIAFIFFPLILTWKFFKGYFIGALIETVYESGISSVAKMLIGGVSLAFLEGIITVAFGLSNTLFIAITGGAETLSELGAKVVGSGKSSGVGSVTEVVNLGLLLFITAICLVLATVFIILGLVFFLRTILIFILFAVSPLAVVAGLTEEFRSWFSRWLQSIQAMLIAPIPVAICLTLVKSFVQTIPSAHDNPAEFMLQMVYVIAFLLIGAILMFKIAGQVGGAVFGLTTAAASFAIGAGAGAIGASLVGNGRAGAAVGGSASQKGGSSTTSTTTSATSEVANSGGLSNGDSAAGGVSGTSSNPGGGGGGGGMGGGGGAAALPVFSASQQQGQLLNALRGLQESMSANVMRTTQVSGAGGLINLPFNQGVARGVQDSLYWAGQEAGVSSPYLVFAPSSNGRGGVTTSTENSSIAWQRSVAETQFAGTGEGDNPPPYAGGLPGYAGSPPDGGGGSGSGDGGSNGAYLTPGSGSNPYLALPRRVVEPVSGSSSSPDNQKPSGLITNDYVVDYGQILPIGNPNPVNRTLASSGSAPMLGAGEPSTPNESASSSSGSSSNAAVPPVGNSYVRDLGEGVSTPGQGSNREYSGKGVPPNNTLRQTRIDNAIPDPYGGKPPIPLPPPSSVSNSDTLHLNEQKREQEKD